MAFGFLDYFVRGPFTWGRLKNFIREGIMNEVLVNAYPKSGVTWLVHLVCDLLEGVHQDNDEMEPVAYDHPITSDWVIRKIHKPYWADDNISYLVGKTVVFSQRDPRDIVVSAMHYRGTTDLDAAIVQLIHSSYIQYIESWIKPGCKTVEPLKVGKLLFASYEHLHFEPIPMLRGIIEELTGNWLTDRRINAALDRQSFPNMVRQLGGDRHFMRKGIVGDWRNHFNREQAKYFNVHFGDFMMSQGYIDNLDWWKEKDV